MRKLYFILALFITQFTFSQEEVKNYEWETVPKFSEIPEEFKDYPAVVLKDYRLYENKVGYYMYKAFVVKHYAVKILKEEGINVYNKVSVNKKYVRDYRDLKARVIKPDGKIVELPEERIIQKDDSDERQFVFEGVEKGDIIEYYYVIKDFPDFSGVEYFQKDIPVLEAKFQINNMSASIGTTYTVGYNGMKNESTNKKHIYTAVNLPAYKDEYNATVVANLAKVYYYVDSDNSYNYKSFYWSLNSFADGVNAKSMIKKFIQELQLDDQSVSVDERLKKMDIYLKENIELDYQENYKKVFDTKKINPRMVLYLYKDVLDNLKIPYQFLASTDRFNDKFDKTFVVPAVLSEILIYIPETEKYLSPFEYWLPYGAPNWTCIDNEAAYFKKEGSRNVNCSFIKVGSVSMDENLKTSESEITVDEDMETVRVNKKSTTTGYSAFYYRNVMKYIKEEKLKDFIKDAVFNEVDVDLKEYTIENKEYRNNYDNSKPFTFNTKVEIKESWLENAGKNYLITLGKVLGKQFDLYQETERHTDIDLSYAKKYNHTIKFNVPEGYAVNSIDNLLFNKELKEDGKVIGRFVSTAKKEGKTIIITIEEFYDFIHLDREKYPAYRNLVNASYDFYKSSIVLSKI